MNETGHSRTGLRITPTFCPKSVSDPFQTAKWERRSAVVRSHDGRTLFEQESCEVPVSWSHLATNIAVSNYFFGDMRSAERETSIRQLIYRVTRTIADWGMADGYFHSSADAESFFRELTWLCLHQYGAFNSPVWFNVGLYQQYGMTTASSNWRWDKESGSVRNASNTYEHPQTSACFIQGVEDNLEDIMRLASSEAMLFRFGSGTGTDLSNIRSSREKLSGGGTPSGPLSFMRIFDQVAAAVKSGGKTRRAAKMQSLSISHPDVLEFIESKYIEEHKARTLAKRGGCCSNGDVYNSVLFQNANLSVRLTDEFMEAVRQGDQWTTCWVTDRPQAGPRYPAKELLRRIAECVWHCGDPGVQFDTTINRWHTCPRSGRINASNPCSEFMFLDDTACNLASVNLMKFRLDNGQIDIRRLKAASRILFIAQDILVDRGSYPSRHIAEMSHRFRPLGLGYSNLGALLMSNGLPYSSVEARALCASVTAILHGAAVKTSAELAASLGPFDAYMDNKESYLDVIQLHRQAINEIRENRPGQLLDAARELWDDVWDWGHKSGFRNAQMTALAPTGTISLMMDCDTTGIEPDIALLKRKKLASGGELRIVNRTVPVALRTLGYPPPMVREIVAHLKRTGTIEGAPRLRQQHLPVFDCAIRPPNGVRAIHWRDHIEMVAAAQPFLSGAVSKTINMPSDATIEDIASAYHHAWALGLKAVSIYRDGSKYSQPLSVPNDNVAVKEQHCRSIKESRRPPAASSRTVRGRTVGKRHARSDKDCESCGSIKVPTGTCQLCQNCGQSAGCA